MEDLNWLEEPTDMFDDMGEGMTAYRLGPQVLIASVGEENEESTLRIFVAQNPAAPWQLHNAHMEFRAEGLANALMAHKADEDPANEPLEDKLPVGWRFLFPVFASSKQKAL